MGGRSSRVRGKGIGLGRLLFDRCQDQKQGRRGHAIDETALVSALRKGKLAGAVLDVFNHEPLPADSPLRSTPNAFLYPHVSAVSPDYLDLYLDELIPRLQHACHA